MGAEEAAITTIMNPEYLHQVCQITTIKILDYVSLMVAAGAEIICFLEPSSVMLGPDQFAEFSGKYIESICNKYKGTEISFVYHICGNTMHLIEKMAQSEVNACVLYFQTFSKLSIPAEFEMSDKSLEYYESLRFPYAPGIKPTW